MELCDDRHGGGTSVSKIYTAMKVKGKSFGDERIESEVLCTCCPEYMIWKKTHPFPAKNCLSLEINHFITQFQLINL